MFNLLCKTMPIRRKRIEGLKSAMPKASESKSVPYDEHQIHRISVVGG